MGLEPKFKIQKKTLSVFTIWFKSRGIYVVQYLDALFPNMKISQREKQIGRREVLHPIKIQNLEYLSVFLAFSKELLRIKYVTQEQN